MSDPSVLVLGVGLLAAPFAFEVAGWRRRLCVATGTMVFLSAMSPVLLAGAAITAGFALGAVVWVALGRL